jgi:cyclic-di-AMP phosphodiesterase PgpH
MSDHQADRERSADNAPEGKPRRIWSGFHFGRKKSGREKAGNAAQAQAGREKAGDAAQAQAGREKAGSTVQSRRTADRRDKPGRVRKMLRRSGFQRGLLFLAAAAAVYVAVLHGATPERYRLKVGDVSIYDINAPRDIVNKIRTEEMAVAKAAELDPVIIRDDRANIEMINAAYSLFESLEDTVNAVRERARLEAVAEPEAGYYAALFRAESANVYQNLLSELDETDLSAMINEDSGKRMTLLKTVLTDRILADLFRKQITEENLNDVLKEGEDLLAASFGDRPWSVIGNTLLARVIKPNSHIDREATDAQQAAFIVAYQKDNPVIISKDERILNKDDIVTQDKWQLLKELNFIESEGGIDIPFNLAILVLTAALSVITLLFIRRFQSVVYRDPNLVALTSLVVVLVCVMAWVVQEFLGTFASLLLPVLIVPILLSTLIGVETAIIVNAVLAFAFMVMFGGDATFALMTFAGGSLAAFLTHQASQRRRLSMSGVVIGVVNAAIVTAMGIIDKKGMESLLNEGGLAFLNGILSMILAIGILPFLEGAFNVITPFKLLELSDPNHPLIKRLLIEAPGTYHHSLMVGNLAEAAIRTIGGNALLARVGAYFHDVGKLKRPNFFKENQMADNPHERLTPNLSTLVITSHTRDGDEMAVKFHLPKAIRDIIVQHHGTTLVAYFYHKATQLDKDAEVDRDTFRYDGPVPDSRESAVVLLADSIEAAIRSMQDKTQGRIEGMVRKIIRDKLEDGQLDRCDLTLRDLSLIADAFLQVLGGAFHERTVYPEIERKEPLSAVDNQIYNHRADPSQPFQQPFQQAFPQIYPRSPLQAYQQDFQQAPAQAPAEGGGSGADKTTFEEGM